MNCQPYDMTDALRLVAELPDAAMITLGPDGSPHAARVELAVVDGRIRSSGSPRLVRAANVRRDPRCTLFVFGPAPRWLAISAIATILDGADHCVALMQARHGDSAPAGHVLAHDESVGADRLYEIDEYRRHVRVSELFVFDFEVIRTYGNP
jgi:hypothetical protein